MLTIRDLIKENNLEMEIPDVWDHEIDEEYEYKYHAESIENYYGTNEIAYINNAPEIIKKKGIIHVFSYPGVGRSPDIKREEDEIIIDLNNVILSYIGCDGTQMIFDGNGKIVSNLV